jgi:hypothetical protein
LQVIESEKEKGKLKIYSSKWDFQERRLR